MRSTICYGVKILYIIIFNILYLISLTIYKQTKEKLDGKEQRNTLRDVGSRHCGKN